MYQTIFTFIKSKSFKLNPFNTILNAIILIICSIFKIKYKFKIQFGEKNFFFTFFPNNQIDGGRGILLYKEKIEPLMEFGSSLISDNSVIIDGGANQGIYSMAFACKSKSNKIFAIEPFKYCHKIINYNKKINKFNNIKIIKKVLSNKIASYKIDYSNNIGTSSIIYNWGGKKVLNVKSTTIDILKKEYKLKKVDIIKLDIEGAEVLALQGALKTIIKFKPKIIMECNKIQFKEISFLRNFGYSSYLYNQEGELVKIKKLEKGVPNLFWLTSKHYKSFQSKVLLKNNLKIN
jgi:FkbM family methyltransferase